MWSIRWATSDLRTKHLTHLEILKSLIQASWLLYTKLCWTHLLLLPALVWHNLLKQEVMDMWRNSSGVLAANFWVDLMAQINVRTSEPFPCAKSCKLIYIYTQEVEMDTWIPMNGYLWEANAEEGPEGRKILRTLPTSIPETFDSYMPSYHLEAWQPP